MKTSKWFYGIALASAVSFTAAADNTPSSTTTTPSTVQNNLIITGRSNNDNQGSKPTLKTDKDKTPTPATTGTVNQGT